MLNARRIFIGLFTALMLSTSAYAADVEVSVFDNNDNANITGIANNQTGRVSACVFNVGKTASDAENMVADSVVFVNQATPAADKSFNFPINMAKYPTGEYTLAVYQEGEKIAGKVFPFAKAADNRAAVAELNDIIAAANGNISSVAQFLEGADSVSGILNRVRLECSSDYDGVVSISRAAAYMTENAPYDVNNKGAVVAAYKKAMLISAFADNKISNIEDAESDIDVLNTAPLNAVYSARYITQTVKSNLAAKISSLAPYANSEAFDTAVKEALVLTVVNYSTGSGDISSVISAVYPLFPAELLTPAVCRAVANKSYATVASLRQAMETAANGSSGNTAGGNSSGGSSGGGSGGGAPMKPGTSATVQNPPVTPEKPTGSKGFSDIEDVSWAAGAINALAAKGIVSGRGNNMFAPKDNITREEFVKMCVVLFKIPTGNDISLNFADVNSESWYYPYIKTAYGAGVIKGTSETSFGVGSYITRQDAAVIINNCMEKFNLKPGDAEAFADWESISDYAKDAVMNMRKSNIISGYEDGSFLPKNNITRAEAAKMLYSADERIEGI